MPYELEIEFKNMLTKDEFYQLVNLFKIKTQDFIFQKNYYYEQDEILVENQMALRIRVKQDSKVITLKQKAVQSKHAQIEITAPFEEEIKEKFDNLEEVLPKPILNHLAMEQIELTELNLIGTMETLRYSFEYQGGRIFLDYSKIGDDYEDYELEFEYHSINDGETIFDNFLVQNNIGLKPAKSKIARMAEHLEIYED